jgi:Tol biopolymer transport system component
LFTIKAGSSFDDARIGLLNLRTGEQRVLLQGGVYPRSVPTGHLVYARAGSLFALPFDLDRFQIKASPVPLFEGISMATNIGFADSFSNSGTLVYMKGDSSRLNRSLVWVDRKGKPEVIPGPPRDYTLLRLSPDGKRVAVSIKGADLFDIWVYELARGTLTRLTFEFDNYVPVWTPDSKRVTFWSSRSGKTGLFSVPADGSGPRETLLPDGAWNNGSWSPDSKTLAYLQRNDAGKSDIWLLPGPGESQRRSKPFLQTQFDKSAPEFSPDGRWIAYRSNESGRNEVYVQPFPGPGGKWQISTDGGGADGVRWSANGRELFYRNDDKMMSVDLETRPTFRLRRRTGRQAIPHDEKRQRSIHARAGAGRAGLVRGAQAQGALIPDP